MCVGREKSKERHRMYMPVFLWLKGHEEELFIPCVAPCKIPAARLNLHLPHLLHNLSITEHKSPTTCLSRTDSPAFIVENVLSNVYLPPLLLPCLLCQAGLRPKVPLHSPRQSQRGVQEKKNHDGTNESHPHGEAQGRLQLLALYVDQGQHCVPRDARAGNS